MVSGWAASHTHLHAPRRSHERSRSSSSDDSSERPRRSSIDATPRQTPATTRFLSSPTPSNDYDPSKNVLSSAQDVFSSSKRLGFFADKLSSLNSTSLSGTGHSVATLKSSLHPSQLLHPHNHSRNESALTFASTSTTTLPAMATTSSLSNVSKSHTSPSKVGGLEASRGYASRSGFLCWFIIGIIWAHI